VVAGRPKRRTAICCPKCGHLEAKARTCDIEMKCRRCNYIFEVVIGPSTETIGETSDETGKRKQADPSQADCSKPNQLT
jgi:phage FluMu protein Com